MKDKLIKKIDSIIEDVCGIKDTYGIESVVAELEDVKNELERLEEEE